MTCFLLTVVGIKVITVNFTDFCTESTWDVVNVYDGHNVTSPLIVSLSGCSSKAVQSSEMLYTLETYTSSRSYMLVEFISDFTVVRRGFNAVYNTTIRH